MKLPKNSHIPASARWFLRIIKSPGLAFFGAPALRLWGQKAGWPAATALMALHALRELNLMYRGKKPVIWTTAYVPSEIIRSAGALPFSPEVAAAVLSALGLSKIGLAETEAQGYSPDLCSFHRLALWGAQNQLFPRPDGLVASSHLCDGGPQLFRNISLLTGAPLFVLDIPHSSDQDALNYVTEQVKSLAKFLSSITKRELQEQTLLEVLSRSNEAREWWSKCLALREQGTYPLSGLHLLDYIYLHFTSFGSAPAVNVLQSLYQYLSRTRPQENPSLRLLWLHLKPYYHTHLGNWLTNNCATVVCEEMTYVYWPPLDPEAPWESLARKMLSHFSLAPPTRRIEYIKQLAQRYKVDGIIHFSHWGCRQATGSVSFMKTELAGLGIPLLVLEGDCIDETSWTKGAVQTRLEAFLESLWDNRATQPRQRSEEKVGGGWNRHRLVDYCGSHTRES